MLYFGYIFYSSWSFDFFFIHIKLVLKLFCIRRLFLMLFVAVKCLSQFHVSQTVISQSKVSGTTKSTLKYKEFGMNFDFEISRVNCI